MTSLGFTGYWREGKRLVMDRNALLPDRCVKCNESADGYRRTVKLQHVSTGAHMLVGALAYAFAKRATIDIGLCDRHRRSSAVTIALASIGSIVLSIAGLTQPTQSLLVPLLAAIGFIGGVVGIVVALTRTRTVRATKITDAHIWLSGVGPTFIASLPDAPVVERGAPLPTLDATASTAVGPAVAAGNSFRAVRGGALAFAIGALATAGTYMLLAGTYLIAWGPMVFGLYRLVRGARAYLAIPAGLRTTAQLATLGGLLAVGIAAGGWVGLQEFESEQFARSLDTALASQQQGAALFGQIMHREGQWTSTDSADMKRVAGYYSEAVDTLAASQAPAAYGWYRDGLVSNFRDAVDIAGGFSRLTASSSQSAFDALAQRWQARVRDLGALEARLTSQTQAQR